jgi:hypothetical protein
MLRPAVLRGGGGLGSVSVETWPGSEAPLGGLLSVADGSGREGAVQN